MNENDDKLGKFLRENRPVTPAAAPGERDRLWAAIRGERPIPTRAALLRFLIPLAASLIAVLAITLRTGSPEPVKSVTAMDSIREALSMPLFEEERDDELDSFITALAD